MRPKPFTFGDDFRPVEFEQETKTRMQAPFFFLFFRVSEKAPVEDYFHLKKHHLSDLMSMNVN